MKELSITESKRMYAGGLSAVAYAAIVTGVSFVIGILDGITRTLKCR